MPTYLGVLGGVVGVGQDGGVLGGGGLALQGGVGGGGPVGAGGGWGGGGPAASTASLIVGLVGVGVGDGGGPVVVLLQVDEGGDRPVDPQDALQHQATVGLPSGEI